ncbi:prospero homeobox protein 1a [Aplochiton taeniatus]
MPDHDSSALLRQTKKPRVDIGVKRSDTLLSTMNPLHDQEGDCSLVPHSHGDCSLVAHSHGDCSLVPYSHAGTNGDGEKSNTLRKLLKKANSYKDSLLPFPGATLISQLLSNNMGPNGGSEEGFQGSGGLSSVSSEIQPEDACSNSSRDSPLGCLSPDPPPFERLARAHPHPPLSSFDLERLSDEHLRAKRARVETIIQGMSHSPCAAALRGEAGRGQSQGQGQGGGAAWERSREGPAVRPAASPSRPRAQAYRENKRKQRLPQQQHGFTRFCARQEQQQKERRQLKAQLEDMQKQLRQLQEKFYQIYDLETEEERHGGKGGGEREDDGNLSEDSVRSDGLEEPHRNWAGRSQDHLSDMDPGLFLDRARSLLREQTLMFGEEEEGRDGDKGKADGERLGKDGGIFLPAGDEDKQLAATLKQELNCAMSQVVDTVVKGFSSPKPAAHRRHGNAAAASAAREFPSAPPDPRGASLCLHLNADGALPPHPSANQRLQCFRDGLLPSPLDSFHGLSVANPGAQTEALPLIVRKSDRAHPSPSLLPPHPGQPSLHSAAHPVSLGFSPPAFRNPFTLPLMGYPFQNPLGPHGVGLPPGNKDHRASPKSVDLSNETVSMRAKMVSLGGHLHRQCSPSLHSGGPESLSLSLIKSECGDLQDMSDISPYSANNIQEGLSPNHLKKAKLMFFYTRYPSSNMLKIFFSDVKFNRCITSQLIKWFSNFREFYYIQMEKFARQAINDGVASSELLSVARDSELFRALNMHYNKANDFEVPERFLEVSQLTLREFFNAIVAGKDVDPSWKKAIYKVICKLDSDVPDIFKSANCLQELLHE